MGILLSLIAAGASYAASKVAIAAAGFGAKGIAAGSLGAKMMAYHAGAVPAAWQQVAWLRHCSLQALQA